MEETNLKDYVCTWPFSYTEVYDEDRQYGCCPNLMGVNFAEKNDFKKDWFGDRANAVRESILDGSYKFCDKSQCSHLFNVIKDNKKSGPIVNKEEFYKTSVGTPKWINYAFDFSCNLACPSCRKGIINANEKKILEIDDRMEKLEEAYSAEAEELHITSTGDPFYSKTYREFLINFDSSKYPKLSKVHLHTNGTLWNKTMWSKMKNVHPYIKSAHISIDAATEETYTKVRLGGKWSMLQSNLKFLSEEVVPNFEFIICSMVVQKSNYKEMNQFVKMITKYFGSKARIQLFKIIRLDFMTDEYWKEEYIYDVNHPEYSEFLKEADIVSRHPFVNQNLI